MLLGENVCTLADGALYADYGVPDFGIVFGPFLFGFLGSGLETG